LAPAFQFTTIDCPDTGMPITVRRTLDPIGQLFVTCQISKHQRDAAEAYATDLEASSLRAPSRGPDDVAGWRGRRADGYNKHAKRLAKANAALTPDQAKAVKAAMAGHKVSDVRQLTSALDVLAVVYGLSTRTRH
jgi:hypothetical protein